MKVRFGKEAQREFLETVSYYESARVGLGRRFKVEIDRYVQQIAQQPSRYGNRPGEYRRVNLRVFPYYLPYIVRGETVWVLAVAHNKRKPLYWISRRDS